jgi:hypothetical protein
LSESIVRKPPQLASERDFATLPKTKPLMLRFS